VVVGVAPATDVVDVPDPNGVEVVDDPAMVLLVVLLEPGIVDVGGGIVLVVLVVGAVVVVVGAVVVVMGAVVVVGDGMAAETMTVSTYR
jgi:hypothetical protein